MKHFKQIGFLILMAVSSNLWAYGSSSSSACVKPRFTDFMPAEHSEVAAESEFSFVASENTAVNSLKVTIKDLATTLKIETENNGTLKVSGKLPAPLKDVYARIAISGQSHSGCLGDAGWLIHIHP
ncbi:MAG: hypothetical protein RL755_418 [Pseudomonadota bacterium]|jgi:hypothetical protein